MIKSMTGYGKAIAEFGDRKLSIEVKSLNSKQLDLALRLPAMFREKEAEVRNLISQKLERGKVDLLIATELTGETSGISINHELAKKYHSSLKSLQLELKEDCPDGLLPLILKMPDVIQSAKDELNENDWLLVRTGIEHALALVDEFRSGEGKILCDDISKRIQLITQYLLEVEPFEQKRMNDIREKMIRDFSTYKSDFNGSAPDQNRFEQEMIYYLERLDITEEQIRLKKHCDYFLDTMDEGVSQGKKLGFITQEIGREINTLGSKANQADIQKIVVQMKDELEKIKEQLMNIL
ncbi:MAG: YicC family protein [Bacteroidetes bacterium]|nr:YicC family protein [Bacteroidota bacterium]